MVISPCQLFRKSDIPDHLDLMKRFARVDDVINRGMSVIVNPDGRVVAGPLDGEEGILCADSTGADLVGPRWQLDIAGHDARPDLFGLLVHREPRSQRVGEKPSSERAT